MRYRIKNVIARDLVTIILVENMLIIYYSYVLAYKKTEISLVYVHVKCSQFIRYIKAHKTKF